MAKPDFNELTKKLNIQGLMDNVKSMINPEGNTPSVSSGDAMGEKMAKASILLQETTKALDEQVKKLAEINRLINDLFKDLEAIRASNKKPESSAKEEMVAKETASDEGMPEPTKADQDKKESK